MSTTTQHIPIAEWGRDHWSTLAYIETRAVDHSGKLRTEQLRCNGHHWAIRNLWHPRLGQHRDYPTRLKDREVDNHDDWDCLLDMEYAGLLTIERPNVILYRDDWIVVPDDVEGDPYIESGLMLGQKEALELTRATYRLTETGQRIAGQLRAHLQSDRKYDTFIPDASVQS